MTLTELVEAPYSSSNWVHPRVPASPFLLSFRQPHAASPPCPVPCRSSKAAATAMILACRFKPCCERVSIGNLLLRKPQLLRANVITSVYQGHPKRQRLKRNVYIQIDTHGYVGDARQGRMAVVAAGANARSKQGRCRQISNAPRWIQASQRSPTPIIHRCTPVTSLSPNCLSTTSIELTVVSKVSRARLRTESRKLLLRKSGSDRDRRSVQDGKLARRAISEGTGRPRYGAVPPRAT